VDEVLELYGEKLRDAEVKTRYDFDGFLTGNRTELHQLVSNLILNAVEAAPDGRASIRIHVFQSRDWRNPDRHGVRLVIADSGAGIPADARPNVFEPFFTTKQEKGTGLGLFVVQWVAIKHGGSVRSSTRPGRSGTCVSVFLCSEAAPKKAPAPAYASRAARQSPAS
jgi:signal transduction histidine kinase